jgi:hypothetical protein
VPETPFEQTSDPRHDLLRGAHDRHLELLRALSRKRMKYAERGDAAAVERLDRRIAHEHAIQHRLLTALGIGAAPLRSVPRCR